MKWKITSISIVVILFFGIILSMPSIKGWNEGDKWGYLWVYDWKSPFHWKKGNLTVSFNGDAYGKTVNAVLITYTGEENGYERFNYEGAYYSYGRAKGTLKISDPDSNTEIKINLDIKIKSFWIVFNGYFHMVKYSASPYESAWGMSDIFMNIYTKKPVDVYEKASGTYRILNHTGESEILYQITGTLSIVSTIEFDDVVPYLPANNTPVDISRDVYANYSGIGVLNTKGKISLSQGSLTLTLPLNVNIKKNINGSTWISSHLEGDGKYFNRTSLIEYAGMNILNVVGVNESTMKTDINFGQYLSSMFFNDKAVYDNATGFYTKVWMFTPTSTLGAAINPGLPIFEGNWESKSAGERDVKIVEENPQSVYGSYQESIWEILKEYILYIVIGVAVIATIIVLLVFLRKRKKSSTHTGKT